MGVGGGGLVGGEVGTQTNLSLARASLLGLSLAIICVVQCVTRNSTIS